MSKADFIDSQLLILKSRIYNYHQYFYQLPNNFLLLFSLEAQVNAIPREECDIIQYFHILRNDFIQLADPEIYNNLNLATINSLFDYFRNYWIPCRTFFTFHRLDEHRTYNNREGKHNLLNKLFKKI